jgi:hypothetical protein
MKIDVTRPKKLYRYSERQWLERSLKFGEFRLRPASEYKYQETDAARHDDELVCTDKLQASSVTFINKTMGNEIKPVGEVSFVSEWHTDYLIISFATCWDKRLFDEFPDTDSCLIIHDVEEFSNRLYKVTEKILPEWIGIDMPVVYGEDSTHGPVFSKPFRFIPQKEWRFAWNPLISQKQLEPTIVTIGDISDIAEIVNKP